MIILKMPIGHSVQAGDLQNRVGVKFLRHKKGRAEIGLILPNGWQIAPLVPPKPITPGKDPKDCGIHLGAHSE